MREAFSNYFKTTNVLYINTCSHHNDSFINKYITLISVNPGPLTRYLSSQNYVPVGKPWYIYIDTYLYRDTHKHSYMHTNIQINRYIHIHNKRYGPFLWIGFNKIKDFHDYIYITPILLLYNLSSLCVVDHLWHMTTTYIMLLA